jgi:transposase-like protein
LALLLHWFSASAALKIRYNRTDFPLHPHSQNKIFTYAVFELEQAVCPVCHAKKLEYHSAYTRNLVYQQNTDRVGISRFYCPICGSSHALLPAVVVPYSPYSLRFMLRAILAYYNRQTSVEQLCAKLEIAVSTLYRWIKRFAGHKQLLLGILLDSQQAPKTFLIFLLAGPLWDCAERFLLIHRFSFMQNQKTIYHPP